MDVIADLLKRADEFCERTGKSKSWLGREVANDARFFERVERGGGFNIRTYQKFIEFFEQNAPPPKGVP